LIKNLKQNSNVGKSLGYDFLREKKIGGKRVYFLIYEDICLILLVGTSNKKTQQDTIDNIKLYLNEYKEYAYQIYNNSDTKN
jgi:putative component of toxin-antitoxin plasmid stabilization module